jgi:1-deoxy-D-xylulose-5-phosphate reductoisomerase
MTVRSVSVFGSTGSVGSTTLDVIRSNREKFSVQVLTAYQDWKLLLQQALDFHPHTVVLGDQTHLDDLKSALAKTNIKILSGEHGLIEAASQSVDLTMAAISGFAGLKPLHRSLAHSKILAVANKEPLVAAGSFVLEQAQKHRCKIVPVDSEHSAIFQVLNTNQKSAVERLILTASGGPFLKCSHQDLKSVTAEQALAHPIWSMGAKISIDSATMMNKALEIIEAHYLFEMPHDKIDVLIHPQHIIHSMVEYADGSILAQLGVPDMRIPISVALGYPDRLNNNSPKLDWTQMGSFEFLVPNQNQFPALKLVRQVLNQGAGAQLVFNSANEVAVEAFLNGQLPYLGIVQLIETTLEKSDLKAPESLDAVFELDHSARALTKSLLSTIL